MSVIRALICGAECQVNTFSASVTTGAEWHWWARQPLDGEIPAATASVSRLVGQSWHFKSTAQLATYLAYLPHSSESSGYGFGYMRCYFRVPSVSMPNTCRFIVMNATTGFIAAEITTAGVLRLTRYDGTDWVYSTTLNFSPSVDTWYGVEIDIDLSTTTHSWRWRVWKPDTGWSAVETLTASSSAMTMEAAFVGMIIAMTAANVEVFVDDVVIAYTTTAGEFFDADTPRSSHVIRLSPNADGTHNFDTTGDFESESGDFAPSATDVYTHLDEPDMTQQAVYLRSQTMNTAEYSEVAFEDSSAVPLNVSVVTHCWSTSGEPQKWSLSDDGFANSTLVVDADPRFSAHFQSMLSPPSGGAWTKAKVNSLKARWSGEQLAVTGGIALEVEVITPPYVRPIADVATTGWSTAPLWSKVDDNPDAPDGTVVTASVGS